MHSLRAHRVVALNVYHMREAKLYATSDFVIETEASVMEDRVRGHRRLSGVASYAKRQLT